MSSLTSAEKVYLEIILNMKNGYVLRFTDVEFGQLFNKHGINIHGEKYEIYGTSKAKKMRSFWERESDRLVGSVLSEMLDVYVAICNSSGKEVDSNSLKESRRVVARLSGVRVEENYMDAGVFLRAEFAMPSTQKLPIEFPVAEIIQARLKEAQDCLRIGAYLSVIFQCGSVLEAVLLGSAQKYPKKFNQSKASPKQNGKVKSFQDWSLLEFINVASEVGLLKPDVQKFSHGLRDFRNYIHPYQQMLSNFQPDEHTAKLCFQVLKAALADVSGER